MKHRIPALLLALLAINTSAWSKDIGPRDIDALPATKPSLVENYGPDPLQLGELRLPEGKGPFPVAVAIHGGCWLEKFADLKNSAPIASDLTKIGIATWNIEYRRNDNGGGWPVTFTDIASAIDHLRSLASRYPLDLSRVVTIGHSAGAPLAVWAAGRTKLARSSPIRGDNPLKIKAAVAIDGPLDLARRSSKVVDVCGQPVITTLLGGTFADQPEHYRQASPAEMLPIGTPVYFIRAGLISESDAASYEAEARSIGDKVMVIHVSGANHFHVIAPNDARYWPVREAIQAAIDNVSSPP